VSPVQSLSGNIIIKEGEKIIYNKAVQLFPLKTFRDSMQVSVDETKLTADVANKLNLIMDPASGVLARPIEAPKDFDWTTLYGLYLEGKEFMDQKLFVQAEEKLKEALAKDHNYLPAVVKMAELKYRNHQYTESLELAKKALSIDTHDGAANYYYGLSNLQLRDIDNAKDGFTLATLSTAFRSAAYTELSRVYLMEKNYARSLAYAAKALDFNQYNLTAYQLQAICYRYLNDNLNADKAIDKIISLDPLSSFTKAEKYFSKKTREETLTRLFQNELPHESYLELATKYVNIGLLDEGEQVLMASPESAMKYYLLAWIQNKKQQDYTQSLQKADQVSPLLVFPFRSEMIEVLTWASGKSESWKPDYYLALLLKDKNRVAESKKLLMQLNTIPQFAPFYAARAELMKSDSIQAELDLKKAIEIDKEEWRYHKLLANHYINFNENANALAVAESYYRKHPENYIIGMLYGKTLLLNKRYKESDQLLSKLSIIPFEGATEGRELYREAKLSLAIQEINRNNCKTAFQKIKEAKEWPSRLGVGKPYDEDIDLRLEDWISYLCYKKAKNTIEAEKALKRITEFVPRVENGISNFLPANHLITAWAMKESGQVDEANKWLDEQIKKFPSNPTLRWAKEMFTTTQVTMPNYNDATMRLIMQLK
jgi:Tfp pilus assembly protein PilF